MSITGILAFIIVLGVLIAFHELGHFLVAKVLRVGVKTYSLGFGPRIFGFRYGRTDYRLSVVPLGGYVSLVGETKTEDGGSALESGFSEAEHFNRRPAWHRMLIIAAGPIFNVVLAWLIFWGVFYAEGLRESLPVVGDVRSGSPADQAGIQPGDEILTVDGQRLDVWADLSEAVSASGGAPVMLTLERGGETITMELIPELMSQPTIFGEEKKAYLIGVALDQDAYRKVSLGIGSAAVHAVSRTWEIASLTVVGFGKLIERVIPLDTVGGPIMIAQMVSQQADQGVNNVLILTALISVNLAILNLLPIPVLDGGHLLFLAIESVRGKPVGERTQELFYRIGFALLITLMLLATYNDIARLFTS